MLSALDTLIALLASRRTLIMGILNLTPDSFSGDGLSRYESKELFVEKSIQQINSMIDGGCDIIDIGAESTRPGAQPLSAEEELQRLEPLFKYLNHHYTIPFSIDTTKASVAAYALNQCCVMVNDISGIADPLMMDVIKSHATTIVVTHNSAASKQVVHGPYGGHYANTSQTENVASIKDFFSEKIELLTSQGIAKNRIILDPGLGFGKSPMENLMILNQLEDFLSLECPLLIGASRKSFIGYTTQVQPHQRLGGSLAALCYAALKGARIIRVHDVAESVQAVRLLDTLRTFDTQ